MTNLLFVLQESFQDAVRQRRFQRRGYPRKSRDDHLHLQAAMGWLRRAAENGQGGVSGHYCLLKGRWLSPFPETTGYIIPTLFDFAAFSGQRSFATSAIGLADWLSSVQLESGACMQGLYRPGRRREHSPVVFNTGQNIFGFLRAYRETHRDKFLNCAQRAGNFLVESVDEGGIWDRHLLRNRRHTINARTCWALLELHRVIPKEDYARVATANLDWTVEQQMENGYFRNGASRPDCYPNSHFIAYTCRGLLESSQITGKGEYLEAARNTADRLLRICTETGTIYAFWDENWTPRGKHLNSGSRRALCLTGLAQMALVWMRLFELTGRPDYWDGGLLLADQVKTFQKLTGKPSQILGAVKGSFPIFAGYATLKYPNWAAKFLADALMMKLRLQRTVSVA